MTDIPIRDLLEGLIAQAMVRHASTGAPKQIELSVSDAERILSELDDTESVNVFGGGDFPDLTDEQIDGLRRITADVNDPSKVRRIVSSLNRANDFLAKNPIPLTYDFDGAENFGAYRPVFDDHGGYDEQPDVNLSEEDFATLMAIMAPADKTVHHGDGPDYDMGGSPWVGSKH